MIFQTGSQVSSRQAELVLQSQATAPIITAAPEDFWMTVGQTRTFEAAATGVPQPSFRWQKDGADIPGATAPSLALAGVTEADTGTYAVIARNNVGSATNTFHLTVTPHPLLVITEVMSSSSTNAPGHEDWWELTNLGTFPVNLEGYRFDDSSETLGAAFTFTNDVSILPGESVIFVEDMTREEFVAWWGEDNLPEGLKVLPYRGNGLSSGGDAVNVWNAAAIDDADRITSAVFSTATAGVTFGYDAGTGQFGDLSVNGSHGAFTAVSGGDIGSPGYIRNTPRVVRPRFTEIAPAAAGLRLTWTAQTGTNYTLQTKTNLENPVWSTVTNVTAAGASITLTTPTAEAAQAFFRLLVGP